MGELFSPQVDIAWLRLYPTLGAVFRIWYTLNRVIAASTKKNKQPCFWVSRRIRAKSERCGLSHTLQQNKCLKHNWRKMEGCRRQAMLQEWFWEVAALAFIPFFALGVKKKCSRQWHEFKLIKSANLLPFRPKESECVIIARYICVKNNFSLWLRPLNLWWGRGAVTRSVGSDDKW